MIPRFQGEHNFLSSFFPTDMWVSNRIFRDPYAPSGVTRLATAEHGFQAAKTVRMDERYAILTADTPGRAKTLGKKVTLRPDWEKIKLAVMYDLLAAKFSDPELRQWLLETGDQELVEGNNWNDTFWGVCDCPRHHPGTGENWLGRLLMLVRSQACAGLVAMEEEVDEAMRYSIADLRPLGSELAGIFERVALVDAIIFHAYQTYQVSLRFHKQVAFADMREAGNFSVEAAAVDSNGTVLGFEAVRLYEPPIEEWPCTSQEATILLDLAYPDKDRALECARFFAEAVQATKAVWIIP